MFSNRLWFLLAALILLDSSPALAGDYLRVSKNGVIFYYYNNRGSVQPQPEGPNSLKAPPTLPGSNSSAQRRLLPASLLVPAASFPGARLSAAARPEGPELVQLLPDPPAPSPPLPEPLETLGAAKDCLARLLTRLGFFDPPDLPPDPDSSPWLRLHPYADLDFVVPDAWPRAPKYFSPPPPNPNGLAAPAPTMPLPQYSYQPRLWGRVPATKLGPRALSSLYYCFPVASPFTFRDSWGEPRGGGRIHRAVDIFAPEGTALFAITSGVIQGLATSPTGGIMLMLRGNDGRGYGYMHLLAYADGIVAGKAVQAGELIGYVGRTGTFNSPPHLHLQVYPDHSFSYESLLDPYDFLVQLCRGIGVTDLHQPRMVRSGEPPMQAKLASRLGPKDGKTRWIQVHRTPFAKDPATKYTPTLVIRNF
jgi:murein DD-endopeptidase MepM/ murein hydrolase activator NlpD